MGRSMVMCSPARRCTGALFCEASTSYMPAVSIWPASSPCPTYMGMPLAIASAGVKKPRQLICTSPVTGRPSVSTIAAAGMWTDQPSAVRRSMAPLAFAVNTSSRLSTAGIKGLMPAKVRGCACDSANASGGSNTTATSTRRFFARPGSAEFSATGFASPCHVISASAKAAHTSRMAASTASARRWERAILYATSPTSSVWPLSVMLHGSLSPTFPHRSTSVFRASSFSSAEALAK